MDRNLVSADELLDILNRSLQARERAGDCVIVGPIKPLETPLPDGGNWDRSLTIRGSPADPYAAGNAAHEAVAEVAAAYNLRDAREQGK